MRHLARLRATVAYALALAIGVAFGIDVLPRWAIAGALPPGGLMPGGLMPATDFAQHVIGQRYFLAEGWGWRLLLDRRLDWPHGGTSIAFTDSIPLVTIATKLLGGRGAPDHQTITVALFGFYVLQPVAAVFALWGAGERRVLPGVAIAVIAISMPSFLGRAGHVALSGHAGLLAALGLYFRLCRHRRGALWAVVPLLPALLLIHPYLMLMAAAVLAAAPLTLALRGDRFAWPVAAAVGASFALMGAVGAVLGYWGANRIGGFGFYSMNLVSPVWPANSGLLAHVRPLRPIDATGGQAFEGYQYLGLGVLGLLVATVLLRFGALAGATVRHAGLGLALAGLTVFALSDRVFAMHHLVAVLPIDGAIGAQARSSGRLFWPVAYALALAPVVLLGRGKRGGLALVLLGAAAQFADAGPLRAEPTAAFAPHRPAFDAARMRALMRGRDTLTILPVFPCLSGPIDALVSVLWLGSATTMRTDTMYTARQRVDRSCLPPDSATRGPVGADELVLVTPGALGAVRAIPDAENDCRVLPPGWGVCTRGAAGLDGLASLPPLGTVAPSVWQNTGAGGAGRTALFGFSAPEPWGVWSDGPLAGLALRPNGRPERLVLRVGAAVPRHRTAQRVAVIAGGRTLAVLALGDAATEPAVTLPPGTATVWFRIDDPVRLPGADDRRLGIKLFAFRVDAG